MSGSITTLYPNEERLKDFIARYIEKVFAAAEPPPNSAPPVMLAYTLHCFFLVLHAEKIKLVFIGSTKRMVIPDLNLIHLKLLQGLLLAHADRTEATPPAGVVHDVFTVLKTLATIVVPPPNLVL